MKKITDFIKLNKSKPYLIFIVTSIVIYLILVTSLVPKKYKLNVGDIAKVDIKAPREVENKVATEISRAKAIGSVAKKTVKIQEIADKADNNIEKLFTTLRQLDDNNTATGKPLSQKEKAALLKERNPVSNFTLENYQVLVNLEPKEVDDLEKLLKESLKNLYEVITINENKPEEIDMAKGIIAAAFNSSNFSKDIREMGMIIGYAEIRPNSIYDEERTNFLKEEAGKNIKPVMIKKDQIIVKEGEPITDEQKTLLESLGLLDSSNNF